jgi:hypothetical protein
MARRSLPRKVTYFEPVPPRLARNTAGGAMTQPIEPKLAAILADIAGYSRLIAPMMKALSRG